MGKHKNVLTYSIWIILALTAFSVGIWFSNDQPYDFKTLDGTRYKHSDIQGDIIVVNYFAQWCAPCLREIPELNEFYHQAADKVKLFGVSFDNLTEEQLVQLRAKYNIEFPLISIIKTDFAFDKPQYLPATFIIAPSGELAMQLFGEQTSATLTQSISALKTK
jgi:thiol-disulfide isomerase/thioredoxin